MKNYLSELRKGEKLNRRQQIMLIMQLSIPAILAQISNILMQYIDASMVGRLGASSSASIGLISSTTWLVNSLCYSVCMGFTVLVAHRIGAGEEKDARGIMKQGLIIAIAFSMMLGLVALNLSRYVPIWLGGEEAIRPGASEYFAIYACFLPVMQLVNISAGMLQCSGNMKFPAAMEVIMCIFDVGFNAILIFPAHTYHFFDDKLIISLPGANLGLRGAALGTGLAELLAGIILLVYLLKFSSSLHLRKNEGIKFKLGDLKSALKITIPYAVEQTVTCGAYVAYTKIVSPLGPIALAANSFAITAESLCYMPGYGIGSAATTIIGQSIGAKREEMAKRLGWVATVFGMVIMAISGAAMFFLAPVMIGILTPDTDIRTLGTLVLRIEAFAEPFYAASIVATGVFRGAGNTKLPCIVNLFSMWVVRIPMAAYLSKSLGLKGAWIAMCVELCVRGLLFLIWLAKWKPKKK